MAITPLSFNPVSGWQDTTNIETKPANESRTRQLLQMFHNQTRDYINNTVLAALNNPVCRLRQSVTENIQTTQTLVTFDTIDFDNNTMSQPANKITCKTAGFYRVRVSASIVTNSYTMYINVNGGPVQVRGSLTGVTETEIQISLNAGDVVSVNIAATSATTTDVTHPSNYLLVEKIG
jgi:uncharacterized protein YgbK (DUF1537 family)